MNRFLPFALAVCLSAPAWAAPGSGAGQLMSREHFDQLDTNKDGVVSRSEYQQFLEQAHSRLDKDGNGAVSRTEAEPLLTAEQFASVDTNDDGQLSREEFLTQVMSDFDRHDRNNDGQLSFP